MKNRVIFFGILFCLLFSGAFFAQADRSAEVDSLLARLASSSSVERVNAAKIITRAGLADQRLYAKVATLLQEGYATGTDADHIDEMAWLCKALAASGNTEYRPLLEEVAANAPSDKLKRYAEQSNGLIEDYAKRSQVLNDTERWDKSLSAEENRLFNMLGSDDLKLRRDAARMMARRGKADPKVFDAAAAALTGMAKNIRDESLYIDTMAWLCNALAASGDHKYVEALKEVQAATDNSKLNKYVSKALGAL
jgi:hypothetical protein